MGDPGALVGEGSDMEVWLVFFSAVLALGILSQWLAWRFRFPSILALLLFGFLAGQFFDQSDLLPSETLFAVVSLSVAVIMLEGGLTLRFRELHEAGWPLVRLVTVGALVTWMLSGATLHYLAGFSWNVAVLVGAILVVTGPTVIGPLLRNVRPKRNLDAILKWEGIVIDPIGAILAVLVFGALFGHGGHGNSVWTTFQNLALTVALGCGLGIGATRALVFVLRRHWIPDFLQSVVILAVAIVLFTVSNLLQHESGLLTVTVLGIGLANQERVKIRHILEFKENLRVILISCLFIILGGRVAWQDIAEVWKEALILTCVLIVAIRPASVFLGLAGSGLPTREKVFLACLAPRGIVAAAVSAIFALELSHLGGETAEEAERIVPVVFSAIFGTVTVYGLAAAPIARALGLASPNPQGVLIAGASAWAIQMGRALKRSGYEVCVIDNNYAATQRARMRGLRSVHANVLSDYASESLDLHGIGKLLAVTRNDEVNSLACVAFDHTLGHSNVYQLRPSARESSERKAPSIELSGRTLFSSGAAYETLMRMEEEGAGVKVTPLTAEFGWEAYRERYGEDAVLLAIIRENGALEMATDDAATPRVGDSAVAFVPGAEAEKAAPVKK